MSKTDFMTKFMTKFMIDLDSQLSAFAVLNQASNAQATKAPAPAAAGSHISTTVLGKVLDVTKSTQVGNPVIVFTLSCGDDIDNDVTFTLESADELADFKAALKALLG